MAFEVSYLTLIFSENGVAHSIHNGQALKVLKDTATNMNLLPPSLSRSVILVWHV